MPVANPKVRTIVGQDGEPWFVASDVARTSKYGLLRKAIRDHCKATDTVSIRYGTPGNPHTTTIPERDIYRLVMRSKLPEPRSSPDAYHRPPLSADFRPLRVICGLP